MKFLTVLSLSLFLASTAFAGSNMGSSENPEVCQNNASHIGRNSNTNPKKLAKKSKKKTTKGRR